VSRQAVNDAKKAFLAAGSVEEFSRCKKRERPPVEPKMSREVEAKIIDMVCGEPHGRHRRWTLRLLADECINREYIDFVISDMTVWRILKNMA